MTRQEEELFLRASEQQGELVAWLRANEFRPGKPGAPECIEKFPLLDENRVYRAIRQVQEERADKAYWFAHFDKAPREAFQFVLNASGIRRKESGEAHFSLKDFDSLQPRVKAEVRKTLRRAFSGQRISVGEAVTRLTDVAVLFGLKPANFQAVERKGSA
jgi:hypothetical protein